MAGHFMQSNICMKCSCQGTFHAKMSTIKEINGRDLTEAENTKKRWQEYIENCTKNIIMTQITMMVWLTHLEPDIQECEANWALGSITIHTASGGDGILGELFKILKDDAVKRLHSICWQIWKIQQLPQDWKKSVFMPIPKKGSAKECSNYQTIVLLSHASKVMFKILQARLQQCVNWELQMYNLSLEKAEQAEIKLPTSSGS